MSVLLIVDGGTTNLRVTMLDSENHQILAITKAEGGVKNTAIDGNNERLKLLLKECIQKVLEKTGKTVSDVKRCIAYGMITSGMGLFEIPHLSAPASVLDLRKGIKTAIFEDILPIKIEFIPGVRNFYGNVNPDNVSLMDMMRGEEVESVGLYSLLNLHEDALFILPGSHNKFVHMDKEGRIIGCMTSISGEMLDAMTHHTIISGSVDGDFCSEENYQSNYAINGARECLRCGLGRAAFAGRILQTLGGLEKSTIQSFILGAVLAEDCKALQSFADGSANIKTYVAGKAPLQQAVYDVLKISGFENIMCVAPEISSKMGTIGAVSIAE